MKLFVIFLLLSINFFACNDNNPSEPSLNSTWFPLQIGNNWQYATNETESVMTRNISGTIKIGKFDYFVWGAAGMTHADTIRCDEIGNIWKFSTGKDLLWFDFSRNHSETYTFPAGIFGEDMVFNVQVRKNLNVKTPAGSFSQCIQFFFDVPQAVDEEMIFTFAPQVGLVVQQNNGWVTYRLKSAQIDERKIGNYKSGH